MYNPNLQFVYNPNLLSFHSEKFMVYLFLGGSVHPADLVIGFLMLQPKCIELVIWCGANFKLSPSNPDHKNRVVTGDIFCRWKLLTCDIFTENFSMKIWIFGRWSFWQVIFLAGDHGSAEHQDDEVQQQLQRLGGWTGNAGQQPAKRGFHQHYLLHYHSTTSSPYDLSI